MRQNFTSLKYKYIMIMVLSGMFGFPISVGIKAEPLRAPEFSSSLEKALEGVPRPFFPEFSRPVNHHYQSAFPDGKTAIYTLDPVLQEKMKKYLKDYRVPYGVFVAIDPSSGKVLALAEYSRFKPNVKGLSVKATYPAASVFKLVTAAAALEEKKAGPDTMISFHGGLYHLRKRNWEDDPERDFKMISLSDALARSANVPFAKVANRWLDNATLLFYANAFGFNRPISFEIPVQISHAFIPEDRKQVAFTAAGFGDIEMSPIHGALIASAIANGGDFLVPHLIEKIVDRDGNELYAPTREVVGQVASKNTTDILKEMMGKTVIMGTSRRAFRSSHRSAALRDITIGGKTGTLTGNDPHGKYSWFVGMAPLEKPEIAIAALVINNGRWRIKGSDIAKEGFTAFFKRSE